VLPSVTVDTYNEELRDEDGFVGDRASGRAFRAILDDWRERLAQTARIRWAGRPRPEISKSQLDKILESGDPVGGWPDPQRRRGVSPRARACRAPLPAARGNGRARSAS
jgi:hypothetical protein